MKKAKSKGSIIGAVGAVLVGASILLFVATIVINSLKSVNTFGDIDKDASYSAAKNATHMANWADWNESNDSMDQIKDFLTVSTILLAVLGIVLIGAAIISYVGGAFGA